MRQEMMGFWNAAASARPYANNLHLAPDNHTKTSSLSFYRPDALPDAQPRAPKHWRQLISTDTAAVAEEGSTDTTEVHSHFVRRTMQCSGTDKHREVYM